MKVRTNFRTLSVINVPNLQLNIWSILQKQIVIESNVYKLSLELRLVTYLRVFNIWQHLFTILTVTYSEWLWSSAFKSSRADFVRSCRLQEIIMLTIYLWLPILFFPKKFWPEIYLPDITRRILQTTIRVIILIISKHWHIVNIRYSGTRHK